MFYYFWDDFFLQNSICCSFFRFIHSGTVHHYVPSCSSQSGNHKIIYSIVCHCNYTSNGISILIHQRSTALFSFQIIFNVFISLWILLICFACNLQFAMLSLCSLYAQVPGVGFYLLSTIHCILRVYSYRCLHRTWDRPHAPGAQKKKKNYTTPLDL